ncbi:MULTISPECIES: MFS transporter [Bacillus cereus group]|uniref:MFS transporter n=1 Tax=Bacillus cereus group TaxID=86661 RepID=UPI00028AD845|nr:MFS transporter [Bacillus toyonensis]OUB10772.1 MFS transporter [Bacillus thuringiensis serovar shandongiensis]QPW51201.1 MFS transporter [Bacillus thuringiensis]MCA1046183.1 MFS transporter [Bacillus toyonensis]MDO8157041.1 MFS transporter [Bacillus toyonensis]MEC2391003.1 MFS transporter [Bacillus toyonensis]
MNENNWRMNIILFLTAQTISLFGSSLVQYAIIWYITLTTSSGAMLTISTVCGFLPQIAISLFAGVWIDRYDRKKMIMLSDGIIAIATLILAILFLTGYKSIWMLFIVLLIRSAGTGVQTPAVNALIPQIVPKDYLMKVNGINSSITSLIMFLSPAVSAVILSVTSIETTFFIDVITAIIGISIMFIIQVEGHANVGVKQKSNLQGIKEGFAYLKENVCMKRLLVLLIIIMILISPAAFLTPLMVTRSFGAEMWRLTASEMTFSAGAAAGGVLIAAWGGFRNRMHTTALACALYGLLMVGLGIAPVFIMYLVFNFLIGITMPCFNTPVTVLLQEKVDPVMHGRMFSLVQIANSCALPLGMIIFGPLADVFSVEVLLIYAGIFVLFCAMYIVLSRKFEV